MFASKAREALLRERTDKTKTFTFWEMPNVKIWVLETTETQDKCTVKFIFQKKKVLSSKGSKDNMRGKSGAMQLYIKAYLHFDKNILIGWRIPLWLQPHLFQPRVLPLSSRPRDAPTMWYLLYDLYYFDTSLASQEQNPSILSRKTRKPTQ